MNILIVSFGGKYRKGCDNFIIKSIRHSTFLQTIRKTALLASDDKGCRLNEIESISW